MTDWRHAAACRDQPPELFWSTIPRDIEDALNICAICQVRQACDDWADTRPATEPIGIAGGLTPQQRGQRRRRRREGTTRTARSKA